MFTMSSLLALFVPLPANAEEEVESRRRRIVEGLRMSPHLLRDVGLERHQSSADDARWSPRHDLMR